MILHCGGSATTLLTGTRPPIRTACLACASNMEQLRTQLDQLHSEAEKTRAKANNARLRLMRLSEAAQKLHREAAIKVQTGREIEARELLFQKKQVMQALEKSRARIALLDELSLKLNEAISLKETKLIENIASDVDIGGEDASSAVRIVSPKDQDTEVSNEDDKLCQNALKFNKNQELQVHVIDQADQLIGNDVARSSIGNITNEGDDFNSLKGISSYKDLLEYLDLQLEKIEIELVSVLRVSALILESEEKVKNSRVQQTVELLEGIRHIRERISSITQTEVRI
ncbi:hypothetical protein NMG60_11021076 [Bertholletia excelsa]